MDNSSSTAMDTTSIMSEELLRKNIPAGVTIIHKRRDGSAKLTGKPSISAWVEPHQRVKISLENIVALDRKSEAIGWGVPYQFPLFTPAKSVITIADAAGSVVALPARVKDSEFRECYSCKGSRLRNLVFRTEDDQFLFSIVINIDPTKDTIREENGKELHVMLQQVV